MVAVREGRRHQLQRRRARTWEQEQEPDSMSYNPTINTCSKCGQRRVESEVRLAGGCLGANSPHPVTTREPTEAVGSALYSPVEAEAPPDA